MAINGAKALRKVADHISITGTASTLNYNSIVKGLMDLKKKLPFVKIFQISTTSPAKHHAQRMNLNKQEMRKLFADILKYAKDTPITLGIYRLEDISHIAEELGKYGKPTYKNISMEWKINNLTVAYFPESIVTAEEFAIDSNGMYFLPFGGDCHLNERPEKWQLSGDLILKNPDKAYEKLSRKYYDNRGKLALAREKQIFKNIL